MKIVQKLLFILLLVLSTVVSAELRVRHVDWAVPVIGSSLDNMYKVDDFLYRSEQPNKSEFRKISKLGIKEVLNLREYHSDKDETEDVDIRLHRIKIATGSITEKQVIKALNIILKSNGPILVHCWHGSDRTGAIIAAYRVVLQGWSKEKAIEELISGGYGHHSFIYSNIADLIEKLDVNKIKSQLNLRTENSDP